MTSSLSDRRRRRHCCSERPRRRYQTHKSSAGTFHHVASQKYRFPEMPNDERDLFSLDVCGFEDRPPLLDLGLVVGRERLRILILARRNFLAEIGEPLAHAGIG